MAKTKLIQITSVATAVHYAVIRRISDSYYLATNMLSFAAGVGYPAFTESGSTPGLFEISTDDIVWPDGQYSIIAYRQTGPAPDTADDLVVGQGSMRIVDDAEPLPALTVMDIIQTVQRDLRMPQSADLTDPHAQLLLSMLNKVQRNFIAENAVCDELKVYDTIETIAGVSLYSITLPDNNEMELLRSLCVSGQVDPLEKFNNDEEFRAYRRAQSTNRAMPLAYRHYSRSGGTITIEVCPVPDIAYTIEYEALRKTPRCTAATDVPLLDADTIMAGMLAIAKNEQGEDSTLDLQVFQAKMNAQGETQGESNWGDVEPV